MCQNFEEKFELRLYVLSQILMEELEKFSLDYGSGLFISFLLLFVIITGLLNNYNFFQQSI